MVGDAVVAAVRALVGGHHVGSQGAGLVQAAQRAVDGGIADLREPRSAHAAQHVVAVAVAFGDYGQRGGVERASQELAAIHAFRSLIRERHYCA